MKISSTELGKARSGQLVGRDIPGLISRFAATIDDLQAEIESLKAQLAAAKKKPEAKKKPAAKKKKKS